MASRRPRVARQPIARPLRRARLFVLAGEPSGDAIGGQLVERLRSRADFELTGVGGARLAAVGLNSLYPMSDLSVMGFSDVALRLPFLLFRLRQTVRHILSSRPHVVVLIDSQVFSALVARGLRRAGYTGRILLYVAPSVWAWKPERAPRLKGLFDEILAVLPFEPQALSDLGGPPTSYVGHPALEVELPDPRQGEWPRPLVALLPGSRDGEIRRHLPVFRSVAESLAGHPGIGGFVLATLPHLRAGIEQATGAWSVPVDVVSGLEVLDQVQVALAGAGTITLELALRGVPTVATYVPDFLLRRAYVKAGRPLIALPNIILKDRIVPEIDAAVAKTSGLAAALRDLLDSPARREAQRHGFAQLRELMEQGGAAGREDAAERVLAHVAIAQRSESGT